MLDFEKMLYGDSPAINRQTCYSIVCEFRDSLSEIGIPVNMPMEFLDDEDDIVATMTFLDSSMRDIQETIGICSRVESLTDEQILPYAEGDPINYNIVTGMWTLLRDEDNPENPEKKAGFIRKMFEMVKAGLKFVWKMMTKVFYGICTVISFPFVALAAIWYKRKAKNNAKADAVAADYEKKAKASSNTSGDVKTGKASSNTSGGPNPETASPDMAETGMPNYETKRPQSSGDAPSSEQRQTVEVREPENQYTGNVAEDYANYYAMLDSKPTVPVNTCIIKLPEIGPDMIQNVFWKNLSVVYQGMWDAIVCDIFKDKENPSLDSWNIPEFRAWFSRKYGELSGGEVGSDEVNPYYNNLQRVTQMVYLNKAIEICWNASFQADGIIQTRFDTSNGAVTVEKTIGRRFPVLLANEIAVIADTLSDTARFTKEVDRFSNSPNGPTPENVIKAIESALKDSKIQPIQLRAIEMVASKQKDLLNQIVPILRTFYNDLEGLVKESISRVLPKHPIIDMFDKI